MEFEDYKLTEQEIAEKRKEIQEKMEENNQEYIELKKEEAIEGVDNTDEMYKLSREYEDLQDGLYILDTLNIDPSKLQEAREVCDHFWVAVDGANLAECKRCGKTRVGG